MRRATTWAALICVAVVQEKLGPGNAKQAELPPPVCLCATMIVPADAGHLQLQPELRNTGMPHDG